MQSFNRAKCPEAIFVLSNLAIHEMDYLHRSYGDVLEIEADGHTISGIYVKGAEHEGVR